MKTDEDTGDFMGTGHGFLVLFFKRNTLVSIIQFRKVYGGAAFIAPEWDIAEIMKDGRTSFIKAALHGTMDIW